MQPPGIGRFYTAAPAKHSAGGPRAQTGSQLLKLHVLFLPQNWQNNIGKSDHIRTITSEVTRQSDIYQQTGQTELEFHFSLLDLC